MKEDTSLFTSHFDSSRASAYDRKIRASIPGYEALHAMAHNLLRITLPEKAHILIAGAGTGMEIVTLGLANPGWRFTAVDISADMLSLCKGNVEAAGLAGRVVIHHGKVAELPAGAAFEAATSILVSHFIRVPDERLSFFKALSERLKGGGLFITADLTADKRDRSFDYFVNSWKDHYALAGIPGREVEEDFQRSMNTVSFIPEEELSAMLASAGFEDIRRFYQAFLFRGWVCTKH